MKDYLISMFIDNELNLDEKIDFVETVHNEQSLKNETVALLRQEKLVRAELLQRDSRILIPIKKGPRKSNSSPWLWPAALFSSALTLAATVFVMLPTSFPTPVHSLAAAREIPYRFVIYHPGTEQAKIIGSFTRWQPVPMKKTGPDGYWSLTLNLPEGEYQYGYLVEDGQQIADPSVPERVQDDFGGENSILSIKAQTRDQLQGVQEPVSPVA